MAGRLYVHPYCRHLPSCPDGHARLRSSAYPFPRSTAPGCRPRDSTCPIRAERPTEAANLFLYNGQYWAFTNGDWYVSREYNGPWIVVEPQFEPRPILLVPVRYYHVPPEHWRQWRDRQPPRWHEDWGREWSTSESGEAANTNGRTNKARVADAVTGESNSAPRRRR